MTATLPQASRLRPTLPRLTRLAAGLALTLGAALPALAQNGAPAPQAKPDKSAYILTPPAPATPRINGPSIFGVRPGSPFLYSIPATGDRPMKFEVEGLPDGLKLDSETGHITGKLDHAAEYEVTFKATNDKGSDTKAFRIVVGNRISLTPAMGWNSWNCWAESVDQQKVAASAEAMVKSGLAQHGWTYINIDDTWQGKRTGKDHALQGNEKFPDMKALCDRIHELGLKAGIYSTPWITSYASHPGGSSNNEDGSWSKDLRAWGPGFQFGKYSYATADANQWAEWGFDYLKYDWAPNDVEHVREMSLALRASGRDIIYSLSNTAPFDHAADLAVWANSWRTTGDIRDDWNGSVARIAFSQQRWTPYAGPGHWNDPDMLVVGNVGWGPNLHPSRMTPDEQYSHITMWCMLSSPLLIGCDLTNLDDFTYNLLSNDEVLAIDQDALGSQARRVATDGQVEIFVKALEDNTHAVAFFNRSNEKVTAKYKLNEDDGFTGGAKVRDLWRQKDLDNVPYQGELTAELNPHGTMLFKLTNTPAPRRGRRGGGN